VEKGKRSPSFDVKGFAAFRERASDATLSQYEKVGFPDEYRAGKAEIILDDVARKLTKLNDADAAILDIGAGCSDLPITLMNRCAKNRQSLVLVDSAEMLGPLPDRSHVTKLSGMFPACLAAVTAVRPRFDAILVYSVIQYVFAEANIHAFVDAAASLLAEGGQLLIGDIPNASMRKRFLSSSAGRAYHGKHFGGQPFPEIEHNRLEPGQIDDAVLLGILARMRAAGFDAYIVPQAQELPMANRREDLLIRRP
jgi:cyclopropane fatty-acyl-phospholipid synthase-like methyltransferase